MTGLPAPEPPPRTPRAGPEKELLVALLDHKNTILLRKVAGLSEEDLRRSPTASSLSLLGILKHTAYDHQWWFRRQFAGEDIDFSWADEDPQFDFTPGPTETAEDIRAFFVDEVERARGIIAASTLDDLARDPQPGLKEASLRGIMLHMIIEMSRHLGQADIIRETIDGSTGD
jgi:uncharacterized damage-inducible protein DinB